MEYFFQILWPSQNIQLYLQAKLPSLETYSPPASPECDNTFGKLKWSIADLLISQLSSNVSLLLAWITGHATHPTLKNLEASLFMIRNSTQEVKICHFLIFLFGIQGRKELDKISSWKYNWKPCLNFVWSHLACNSIHYATFKNAFTFSGHWVHNGNTMQWHKRVFWRLRWKRMQISKLVVT